MLFVRVTVRQRVRKLLYRKELVCESIWRDATRRDGGGEIQNWPINSKRCVRWRPEGILHFARWRWEAHGFNYNVNYTMPVKRLGLRAATKIYSEEGADNVIESARLTYMPHTSDEINPARGVDNPTGERQT
jgi:hypothetical protein